MVVDAYSKWFDITTVNSTTSTVTIESLRKMFATHGIPESIVSDNVTVFASEEFTEFVTMPGGMVSTTFDQHRITQPPMALLNCSSDTEGILEKNCSRFFTNKSF